MSLYQSRMETYPTPVQIWHKLYIPGIRLPAWLWMTVSPYWIMLSKLHLLIIICKYPPFVFLLLIRLVILISAWLLFTAGARRGQAINRVQGCRWFGNGCCPSGKYSTVTRKWFLGSLGKAGPPWLWEWSRLRVLNTLSHIISSGSWWVATVLRYCGPELQSSSWCWATRRSWWMQAQVMFSLKLTSLVVFKVQPGVCWEYLPGFVLVCGFWKELAWTAGAKSS